MGVWLYTGLPGAGKTLCVVQELIEQILKPGPDGSVPPVYADIKGLAYDRLGVHRLVPEDCTSRDEAIEHCRKWYEVEDGAYIIIDECQRVFPVRNSAAAVPRYVSEFETHRHHGFNILLITQGPNLFDKHVRTLVERHVHLKRTFGLSRSLRVEWPNCEDSPQSSFTIRRGVTSTFKFPVKYYGLYKSATIHNQQRRVPWKLLLSLVFWSLVAVGGFAWYLYDLQRDHFSSASEGAGIGEGSRVGPVAASSRQSCSVALSGVLGGHLFYTDLASGREFSPPEHVITVRDGQRDYLKNLRTGRIFLICVRP